MRVQGCLADDFKMIAKVSSAIFEFTVKRSRNLGAQVIHFKRTNAYTIICLLVQNERMEGYRDDST